MTSQESTDPASGDEGNESPLDRAAGQGRLPETSGDEGTGDGAVEDTADSTDQAEIVSSPGVRLHL